MLDEAGVETAHLVGNSLGGYLALLLAARGRARSVVALAPAGGADDHDETLAMQERGVLLSEFTTRPLPPDVVASPRPPRVRACDAAPLIANARDARLAAGPGAGHAARCGSSGAPRTGCCRGRRAAERYRRSLHAEWIELDGVGHAPQLDVPLETAQLILGFM